MDKLTKFDSGDIPGGVMVVAAVLLFLIALKAQKFFMKLTLGLIALGLVSGAVWWHLHK